MQHDRAGPRDDQQRPERGCDAPSARAAQERRPVVARDREARAHRRQRGVGPGEQRTERALGNVGDARDRRAHRIRRRGTGWCPTPCPSRRHGGRHPPGVGPRCSRTGSHPRGRPRWRPRPWARRSSLPTFCRCGRQVRFPHGVSLRRCTPNPAPSRPPTAPCAATRRCLTKAPTAAVVVVQEAFGVNNHIEDVTRRFAAAGYHAVAPDFFHRAGGGTAEYGDWDAVMKLFGSVSGDADGARRRRRRARPSACAGVRRRAHRHRRVLLRRPRHVHGVVAPRARCCRRFLRRRHRHRALPTVPAARRAQRVVADAVARTLRR